MEVCRSAFFPYPGEGITYVSVDGILECQDEFPLVPQAPNLMKSGQMGCVIILYEVKEGGMTNCSAAKKIFNRPS